MSTCKCDVASFIFNFLRGISKLQLVCFSVIASDQKYTTGRGREIILTSDLLLSALAVHGVGGAANGATLTSTFTESITSK